MPSARKVFLVVEILGGFGGTPNAFARILNMPWHGKARAYLVVPFALAADGLRAEQSETICFDHDLAIEIAETESEFTSGVGVYPLDQDGHCLTYAPIAWYGPLEPPTDSGQGARLLPVSFIHIPHLANGGKTPPRLH
jgi:hypothetical protein